ncbi:MAG: ABC transporter permease, partial [Phycisphaerales bacterium]
RIGPEATTRTRFPVQQMLVTGQVAVSLVVLVVAGLLLRTLVNLQRTDPGFDPDRVLLASVNLAQKDYDGQQVGLFYEQLLARAETIPAVAGVTLADRVPIHAQYQTTMTVEGYDYGAAEHRRVHFNRVWPSYFSVMGIPVLRGRAFDGSAAAASPPAAVVNRTMAERFWNGDALGKRIFVGDVPFEVTGIVADGKYHGLKESPRPFVYFSIPQYQSLFDKPLTNVTLVARTTGDPLAIAPAVRDGVRDIAPSLAAPEISTLHDHLSTDLAAERMSAILVGALGTVVVVLVTIGMYGLMSYSVARRTREIGLRMALGARRRHIAGMVFGRGAVLTGLGVGIGLLVALGTTRILASRLHDISATDPATFAGVAALLVSVALLACYAPARRASRVDAMTALRYE